MTAPDFGAAMLALADKLAGLRPALSAQDLNPPGVLILPPAAQYRFSDGSYTAEWTVIAVVPNAGTAEAMTNLSGLVSAIRSALDGEPVRATPYTLTVDGLSDPLPAYQVTWAAVVR